jgi:hypothetical protein
VAFHQGFTSPRATLADPATLQANVRAALNDQTVGISAFDASHYDVDKDALWSPADIAACQSAIDACPAQTPQSLVKAYLDNQSLVDRAKDLANLDQFNLIRSKLVPPLPAITPAQALNAVKAKVDTLTP